MKRQSSPAISYEMACHMKFLVMIKRLYQHQAAALLGVNPGRVNEVIKGKVHPTAVPVCGPFPT